MTKGIVICLTAWMFVAAVTVTTAAQSNALGPNTQELRQQLNELQAQMNKVQARLDQLENEKVTGTPQPQAVSAGQTGTIQASPPPAQGPTSPQVGEETATYGACQLLSRFQAGRAAPALCSFVLVTR